MKMLSKKLMSLFLGFTMVFGLSTTAFAASTSSQLNQIDYASIVENLDLNELTFFIQKEKINNPTISENELEQKVKFKVLQDGLNAKIITINSDDSVTFNNNFSTYSYSDLPIIKNRLRDNEKRVFNKSLTKGIYVLSAAQTAMSNYKRYYDSTSGWTDDNADAFRHAVWMMLSAHYAGASYAREFGIAHEDDYRDSGPTADLARKMDLSNNDVGIKMAKKLSGNTPEEDVDFIVLMLVNDAVKNGELKRFKGSDIGVKSYLVPTNSVGSRKK